MYKQEGNYKLSNTLTQPEMNIKIDMTGNGNTSLEDTPTL